MSNVSRGTLSSPTLASTNAIKRLEYPKKDRETEYVRIQIGGPRKNGFNAFIVHKYSTFKSIKINKRITNFNQFTRHSTGQPRKIFSSLMWSYARVSRPITKSLIFLNSWISYGEVNIDT